LDLDATRSRVGEDKASAETERKASGFKGVSTGRYVVHKIGLAEGQYFSRAGEVVLLWQDRTERVLVPVALGWNGLCAVNCLGDLGSRHISRYVVSESGVCVGVPGAVGYRYKPAWAGDECGHFSGSGVEVHYWTRDAFYRVGKSAGFGLLNRERAIARSWIFAGGENLHGVIARARELARAVWFQSSSGIMTVIAGCGSSMSSGPQVAISLMSRARRLSFRT
jgi:hypothetical protein